MPVYVDRATYKPGRLRNCRMIADNDAELLSMAENINIRKKRIQRAPLRAYFTLCKRERDAVLEFGAIDVPHSFINKCLTGGPVEAEALPELTLG